MTQYQRWFLFRSMMWRYMAMLCINVVVVSWHCKSPLCRLHPTVDPSHIGEERGREEREGEGAPKGPELENCSVTAGSLGDQGGGWGPGALASSLFIGIHQWWLRNNSLHNSCVRWTQLFIKGAANKPESYERSGGCIEPLMIRCRADNSGSSIDSILSPPPSNWDQQYHYWPVFVANCLTGCGCSGLGTRSIKTYIWGFDRNWYKIFLQQNHHRSHKNTLQWRIPSQLPLWILFSHWQSQTIKNLD